MDDRLAINVLNMGEMSKELKTILYKEFRGKKFAECKPHVAAFRKA